MSDIFSYLMQLPTTNYYRFQL